MPCLFQDFTLETLSKSGHLGALLLTYMRKDHSERSYEFYFSHEGNEDKFKKYIKTGAPKEVNIPGKVRKALEAQAERGEWSQMNANLARAKEWVGGAISSILIPFSDTEGYTRWWVTKNEKLTPKGDKALALLTRNIGFFKDADKLKPLMLIIEGDSTPSARKAAFDKLNKMLRLNIKAASIFRTAGLPVPK